MRVRPSVLRILRLNQTCFRRELPVSSFLPSPLTLTLHYPLWCHYISYRAFLAFLWHRVFRHCAVLPTPGTVATDMELFAKHAKRSNISMEDVKLVARRSEGKYCSKTSAHHPFIHPDQSVSVSAASSHSSARWQCTQCTLPEGDDPCRVVEEAPPPPLM